MRSPDMPPNRSLDDSHDRAGPPDGRARPPAELLDNLRLRLSQLPENHPSAIRQTSQDAPATSEHGGAPHVQGSRDRVAPRDRISLAESSEDLGGSREAEDVGESREAAARQHDGQAPGGGSLGDLIRAVKEAGDAFAGSAGSGAFADVDVLLGGSQSEPYRPWFMAGEVGTPWFAATGEA
jgi:hypothetical protein